MLKLEQEIFPAPLIKNEMNNPQNSESDTNILFLQILGTNDVTVDYYPAFEYIEFDSIEDIEHEIDKLENSNETIQFPLIEKALNEINKDNQKKCNIYLGIVLTDQRKWAEKNIDRNENQEEWKQIVICDGHWWHNFLGEWVEKQESNLTYCPLIFAVEESNIETGAADWEGMAKNLERMLLGLVNIDESPVSLNYNNQLNTKIDKILIQYSSGTPALSSALYLWGIETNQKLNLLKENSCSVQFAYLSRQDSIISLHDGDHWQWRLKVPQLEKLLEIQDFSGVLSLLTSINKEAKENSNKGIEEGGRIYNLLKRLDEANSFNLKQLNFENPEDEIIERISLAIWSEKAFREKGHWLQWYLRLAGAFELALLSLVKYQSFPQNNIQWKYKEEIGISLIKLMYIYDSNEEDEIKTTRIENDILKELLGKGKQKKQGKNHDQTREIKPIKDHDDYKECEWEDFKAFYIAKSQTVSEQEIKLSYNQFRGFSLLRNKLYHTLQGDVLDKQLDECKKDGKIISASDDKHPASIAVKKLKYILQLANLWDKVEERVNHYVTMVEEVDESFKQAPTEK